MGIKIRNSILIAALLFSIAANAGGEVEPRGARSVAMGNSSVMLQGIWSAFNNQAGLVGLNGLHAGGFYHSLFHAEGLADQGFVLAYGKNNRSVALDVTSFGIDVFKENKFGFAYAMSLGEKLDMGVQLNYHTTQIAFEDYGSKSSLTAEIGLMSHLTDDLTLAFHLFNPSQTKLSEFEDERIPTKMKLGGSYAFNEKVLLVSEVTKDIENEAIFRAGLEYRVKETVYVRGGVSTEPVLSSFGAGVELGALDVDIAASYHNTLGYSTQISLSYSFNDNAK